MAMQTFDKLNNFRSLPFEKYFGEMDLTDEQKKKRIALTEEIDTATQGIIMLIAFHDGEVNANEVKQSLASKLMSILKKVMDVDIPMKNAIATLSADIVDSTIAHIDDDYYTSDDRIRFIAEDESNTFWNADDFNQAVMNGMTKKTWISMRDRKVRDSHYIADGQTVPIDEPFTVGYSLMMYPKDMSLGASPEEIINCRCTVRYSK